MDLNSTNKEKMVEVTVLIGKISSKLKKVLNESFIQMNKTQF